MSSKRTAKMITTTAVIVGVFGVATYYAYSFLKGTIEKIEDYIIKIPDVKTDFDFVLNEDFETEEYLGVKGLKLLEKRITEDLNYGPEINGLQSINIVEGKYISDSNNGTFIEATKQIFINSKNMRKLADGVGDINLEKKVEVVFQALSHEYNHYLASRYLKNNCPTDDVADIYGHRGTGVAKETWDKYFVNNFKRILGYDTVSIPYPIKTKTYSGKTYDLLPSIYTSKELFDNANARISQYTKDISNAVWSGNVTTITPSLVTLDKLKYQYSLDELVARKYMQSHYALKRNSHVWYDHGRYLGWMASGSHIVTTTFLNDTLKYQPEINPNDASTVNWRFYSDAPFSITNNGPQDYKKADEMNALMLEEMGQKTASGHAADISVIFEDNQSRMDSATHSVVHVNDSMIKFGGFIPNVRITHVGYYDDKHQFVPMEIKKHEMIFGNKHSLDDETRYMPSGNVNYYTLKDFVDGTTLANHPLYFAEDENGKNPIKMVSTRDTKVGKTTNYYDDHSSSFGKIFVAEANNNGVVINTNSI